MSGEVLVDALPYIDTGYEEPGVREAALAMVEEETKEYRPTKNYLEHLPPLDLHAFETDIMRGEFERMSARHPMDQLPMKRYELPHPPAGKMTDPAAWNECVDNSMAQLQHQFTRIANLELMMEFSCEAWRSYSTVLTNMLAVAQRRLHAVKKAVQELNWQRKSHQTSAGDKIKKLEADWVTLVSKNFEIELECLKLQRKIEQLKREGAPRPSEPRRRKPLPKEDEVPPKPKYRKVEEEGSSGESDEERVSRKRKRYEEADEERKRERSPVKRRPYPEDSDEEEEYVDKDDLRKYDLAGTVSDEEEEEEEQRRRDAKRRYEEREEREEKEREREEEREKDEESKREEREERDWKEEEEWRDEKRKREGRWDQRENDRSDDSEDEGRRERRRRRSSSSSSSSSSDSEKEGGGEAMDLENTDSE